MFVFWDNDFNDPHIQSSCQLHSSKPWLAHAGHRSLQGSSPLSAFWSSLHFMGTIGVGDSAVNCRETAVEGTPMCKPPVVQSDSNRFPTSSVNTYALSSFTISLMKLHQVIDGTFSISAVWPEGLVCEAAVMGSWGRFWSTLFLTQTQFGW